MIDSLLVVNAEFRSQLTNAGKLFGQANAYEHSTLWYGVLSYISSVGSITYLLIMTSFFDSFFASHPLISAPVFS